MDVLSFPTTLSGAVDLGVEVFPYAWRDASAVEFAGAHDAMLAVGRLEAAHSDGLATLSLSPHTIRSADGLSRLVLPSPNGSTIAARLASAGIGIVGASLRNRAAVARWLEQRLRATPGAAVTVNAAGERWPDGSLRPAVEDLWGARAVIAALHDLGVEDLSPEAHTAAMVFRAVEFSLVGALTQCGSGRELDEATFAADVTVAGEIDSSASVPLLVAGRFIDVLDLGLQRRTM